MQELIEEIEEIMDDEEETYWTQRKEIILQLLKNIEDNINQLKETRYFLGYSKLTTSKPWAEYKGLHIGLWEIGYGNNSSNSLIPVVCKHVNSTKKPTVRALLFPEIENMSSIYNFKYKISFQDEESYAGVLVTIKKKPKIQ